MTRATGKDDPACNCIDCLIARSSIGTGLRDIQERGIDAHLRDLEREVRPRRRLAQRKAGR